MLSLRRELERKSLHILFAAVPIGYAAGVDQSLVAAALGGGCLVAVAIEVARHRHPPARIAFDRLFGALLRPHERDGWSGATWMLVACFAAVVIATRPVAVAAMWAVSIGDAAAALVGRAVQTRSSSPSAGKSVAGSVACLAATLAGALAIAHLHVGEAVAAAVVATAAERPVRWGDDNLRIAAAVMVGIPLWRMVFS